MTQVKLIAATVVRNLALGQVGVRYRNQGAVKRPNTG